MTKFDRNWCVSVCVVEISFTRFYGMLFFGIKTFLILLPLFVLLIPNIHPLESVFLSFTPENLQFRCQNT